MVYDLGICSAACLGLHCSCVCRHFGAGGEEKAEIVVMQQGGSRPLLAEVVRLGGGMTATVYLKGVCWVAFQ